jgi:hypothetical protein
MNFVKIVNNNIMSISEADVDAFMDASFKNPAFGKAVLLRDGKIELENMTIEVDNSVPLPVEVVEEVDQTSEPVPQG